MSKDFTFDGFSEISVKDDGTNSENKLDNQVDQLVDDLADLAKFDKAGEGMKRTTALAATLHLGAQYTLPAYDRLNHTLSLSVDRIWRRRVVRIVGRLHPRRVLDMATGTGDLAVMMARSIPEAHIKGVDLSEGMLDVARRKVAARGLEERVTLEAGDAETAVAAAGSVDVVTVAFGVRNFGDLGRGLAELSRALRPGGRIVILEFSTPTMPVFGRLYDWYSHRVLPRIGGWLSHDRQAYDYLPRSVDEFPQPEECLTILAAAGFRDCRARSQSCGIAQIYTAEKC